ncbi:MAG: hypothetical protein ABF266_04065, partial [Celeribacter marinus]
ERVAKAVRTVGFTLIKFMQCRGEALGHKPASLLVPETRLWHWLWPKVRAVQGGDMPRVGAGGSLSERTVRCIRYVFAPSVPL